MRYALLLALLILAGCRPEAPTEARAQAAQAPPAGSIQAETTVLAGPEEPGERLVLEGRVLDYAGRPLSGAALVAYQADRDGLYNPPDAGTRVPRLRAVAVTNSEGAFRFATIRPGTYPDRAEPAHLHLEVNAPAHRLRYVAYWFADDPLVTPAQEARAAGDAEIVIVAPVQDATGTWRVRHDIRLDGN